MELQKPKQTMIIASVASLALLLAMGTANAGKPDGSAPNNKGGASIGVSNICKVVDTIAGAELEVTTTIIDKTVSKTKGRNLITFGSDNTVQAQQKVDNPDGAGKVLIELGEAKYIYPVIDADNTTFTQTTTFQLCLDGEPGPDLDPSAVSLNALVTVDVTTDNKGYYTSQCSVSGTDSLKLAMNGGIWALCAPAP